jgi:hypothetical protein
MAGTPAAAGIQANLPKQSGYQTGKAPDYPPRRLSATPDYYKMGANSGTVPADQVSATYSSSMRLRAPSQR